MNSHLKFVLFPFLVFFMGILTCPVDDVLFSGMKKNSTNANTGNERISNRPLGDSIRIRVGASTFTATLMNNATADAFKAQLPMTITMTELNGNEKYFDLPNALPANPAKPATIRNGDLMLYGSSTLVLFYKTFSTPYNYTKIARIENTAGLATALGSGNAKVTFDVD